MLTQQQVQQMDQDAGLATQPQDKQASQPTLGGQVFSDTRNVSNILQQLGLGEVPELGGAAYEANRGVNAALGNQNAFQPDSDPFLTDQQLAQYSSPQKGAQQAAQNIAGAESWGVGGLNPLGMAAKPLMARAAIGGVSGLGQNIAQGQGGNLKSDVLSAIGGAGANALLPPALVAGTGRIAKLAFGKTAGALPALGRETGQIITGIGSKGAKAAASNIGQKISDLYNEMGTGLTKGDIFNQFNDVPQLNQSGLTPPTNLDYFLKEAGIPAEGKLAAQQLVKTLGNTSLTRLQGALAGRQTQATSGAIEKEFNSALDKYLSANPDIAQQVEKNGLEKVELPAAFWRQFQQAVKPSEKVFQQMKNPLYTPTIEDKIRTQLSGDIANKLQTKMAQESPQSAPRLQQLNKLYSAIQPIASGLAKPEIGGYIGRMAPLAGAAMLAAPLTGMQLSPYYELLGTLGLLMNPSLSGTVASKAAVPATDAIVNALTSLGASKLSQPKQPQ